MTGSIDRPARIVVDLTPLLPGGINGGAKTVISGLVRSFGKLAPKWEFDLLTIGNCLEEFEKYDHPNVHLRKIAGGNSSSAALHPETEAGRERLKRLIKNWVPMSVIKQLDYVFQHLVRRFKYRNLIRRMEADLLFCPFPAPLYYDGRVPLVATVHDLQFLYHPRYFDESDCFFRTMHFRKCCRKAARIICVSEYVRSTVLKNSEMEPSKVVVVYNETFDDLPPIPRPQETLSMLDGMGLKECSFLIYPANFWPHKNHERLFEAYAMYCLRHPESDLKLVCTGESQGRGEELASLVRLMNLEGRVLFPGYLPRKDFESLLMSAKGFVFPSLFEGFGIPVVEAMKFGKPVACSNLTSLPEIAADAAIYFDPRNAQDIAAAIEKIALDENAVEKLVRKGLVQAARFGGAEKMASKYLDVFIEVLESSPKASALENRRR